jgi:hypothetical protein
MNRREALAVASDRGLTGGTLDDFLNLYGLDMANFDY